MIRQERFSLGQYEISPNLRAKRAWDLLETVGRSWNMYLYMKFKAEKSGDNSLNDSHLDVFLNQSL